MILAVGWATWPQYRAFPIKLSFKRSLKLSKTARKKRQRNHLYHTASILPEFLKGADALLYHALTQEFEVFLHPIVIWEIGDPDSRRFKEAFAYRFDYDPKTMEGDVSSVKMNYYSWGGRQRKKARRPPSIPQVPLQSCRFMLKTLWTIQATNPSQGNTSILVVCLCRLRKMPCPSISVSNTILC